MGLEFLYNFDFLSIEPKLYIFREERYKSMLGSIFGLISSLLIIALSGYFIYETLNKNGLTIIYNQMYEPNPLLNMTNLPLMLTVMDIKSKLIPNPNESIYNMKLLTQSVVPIQTKDGITTNTTTQSFDLEKCDLNKHFGDYKAYFKDVPYLTDYYCIPANIDLTIHGVYGDVINGYRVWSAWVNKCVNSTSVSKCDSAAKVESYLNTAFWTNIYLDYDINNQNFI